MNSDTGPQTDPIAPLPPSGTVRRADQVYGAIVEFIVTQGLKPGGRLPSENGLAQMFGVSRPVVREALFRLSADGLTESRVGAGSFVVAPPSEKLMHLLPAAEIGTYLGTYEIRIPLESAAARLAAQRRTNDDVVAITDALDRLRHAVRCNLPAHEPDMALHRAITIATKNALFIKTFDDMHDLVEGIMAAGVVLTRAASEDQVRRNLEEHVVIVDAIHARDPDRAETAMRTHLLEGRRRLMR